ncbi:hypothetical protein U0070_026605 [Myodes glareolus]|uniref:Uncharacterized protein n=1 Tax=Myodes glareolus TaxID=447135 RepID=A0AAW0JMB8_MYOGA
MEDGGAGFGADLPLLGSPSSSARCYSCLCSGVTPAAALLKQTDLGDIQALTGCCLPSEKRVVLPANTGSAAAWEVALLISIQWEHSEDEKLMVMRWKVMASLPSLRCFVPTIDCRAPNGVRGAAVSHACEPCRCDIHHCYLGGHLSHFGCMHHYTCSAGHRVWGAATAIEAGRRRFRLADPANGVEPFQTALIKPKLLVEARVVLTACNPNLEKAWTLGIHPLRPSLALEFAKQCEDHQSRWCCLGICARHFLLQLPDSTLKAVLEDTYLIIKESWVFKVRTLLGSGGTRLADLGGRGREVPDLKNKQKYKCQRPCMELKVYFRDLRSEGIRQAGRQQGRPLPFQGLRTQPEKQMRDCQENATLQQLRSYLPGHQMIPAPESNKHMRLSDQLDLQTTIQYIANVIDLLFPKTVQEVHARVEVTGQVSLLQAAHQKLQGLQKAIPQGLLGPGYFLFTQMQNHLGQVAPAQSHQSRMATTYTT